ncbi:MAG TPA: sugar phosphate isomerase/epimerase [Chloroflexi bacterium]|jgi:sugar phosphate isomerase/epimerase|nr:sugar phosphate isomerase/epimerase [Chloroflexota bacterium]
MAGRIEIGICLAPERVPALSPGYDYLELGLSTALSPLEDDAAFATRGTALQTLRPQVRAFNVFAPRTLRLTGDHVDWEQVETYVRRGFRRAGDLGGEVVVFGSGASRSVPEGFSRAIAWGQLVRFLNICANHAAQNGLVVAIEPLNKGESNILNTYPEAVRLARDVARDEVRVLADIYHFMQDGEPLDDILEGPEWLAHVHLADTGRRWPGSGTYPLERLFDILRDIDYRGRASIECSWGDDFTGESARSLRFLKALLR